MPANSLRIVETSQGLDRRIVDHSFGQVWHGLSRTISTRCDMKRVPAILATAAATVLLLVLGCAKSYDIRLYKTLERMKYEKRLNDNLMPASKGKFETLLIYVRPPKKLEPSKEFLLTTIEPNQYDLTESFLEKDKQTMHVLARVKRPKSTAKPKPGAKPEPVMPPPGRLGTDVVAMLNAVYGVELDLARAKEVKEKDNVYKHLKFEGNGKVVQLYMNVVKNAPYEVALIFEYPKAEESALSLVSKIKLCLESYATGERARKAFAGSGTEDESESGPAAPVAF